MPIISEVDIAIIERLICIHFPVTFTDLEPGEKPTLYKRQRDNDLKDKLRADLPGVFNWLVQGSVKWYASQDLKKNAPKKVKDFGRSYLEEQDKMKMFINECCEVKASNRVSTIDLLDAFMEWSGDHCTSKWLVPEMKKKGFEKKGLRLNGIQTKCFDGISLST